MQKQHKPVPKLLQSAACPMAVPLKRRRPTTMQEVDQSSLLSVTLKHALLQRAEL
jgi:hypothetical protein